MDTRPRVLLQRGALLRVITLDRLDQSLNTTRQEILDIALRRHTTHLPVHDKPHHRHEHKHQTIPQHTIPRPPILQPNRQNLRRRRPDWTLFDYFHSPAPIEGDPAGEARPS